MRNPVQIKARIDALRDAMKQQHIDVYIALSSDPHLSEYLPEYWQIRQWLSGFTGSVATLVVTANFAGLWVDSRYWQQADYELQDSGITVMRLTTASSSYLHWLADNVENQQTVALDGAVTSLTLFDQLNDILKNKTVNIETKWDVIASLWHDRPALPQNAIYEHEEKFVAQSRTEKLAELRVAMREHHAQWHLLCSLDDIAWLTNLRGSDVSYNPVFMAHMLIGEHSAQLFVDKQKLSSALIEKLHTAGITLCDYNEITSALSTIPADETLLLDANKVTVKLIKSLNTQTRLVKTINPTTLNKSCKKPSEIAHIRQAMEEDGVALCEFFAWFDQALANNEQITELTIDEKLTEARRHRPLFVSQSFSTIAAFNANAALPHYRATEEKHAEINANGLLLIDSGAQYQNGTTDITRMYAIGELTAQQKRDCTLVLKAHIALSCLQFPNLIAAPLLDSITRAIMWQHGLDYGHGTGHGVGYFLNVHEGPQVISYHAPVLPQSQMKAGMVTSIEPGLYRPGLWGIRIENLVANITAQSTEFGQFLQFEVLTLCPIDTRCIEVSLLTDSEKIWLNQYHANVYKRLHSNVSGAALQWLEGQTKAI